MVNTLANLSYISKSVISVNTLSYFFPSPSDECFGHFEDVSLLRECIESDNSNSCDSDSSNGDFYRT